MKISRLRVLTLPILGFAGVLATSYAIGKLSDAILDNNTESQGYVWLLGLILTALGVFLVLSIWQVCRLISKLRRRTTAAKLSLSFALRMIFSALIPIAMMGYFSWQFLSYDLSQTFNHQLQSTIKNSLDLAQTTINIRTEQALEQTQRIASDMVPMNYSDLINNIERLRRHTGATELAVFDRQGNIVASAYQNLDDMTSIPPTQAMLLQVYQHRIFFDLLSDEARNAYSIRVLSVIPKEDRGPFYLQAIYPMPWKFNTLAKTVRKQYQDYQNIQHLQPQITSSLILVLLLVITLSLLITTWVSIYFGEHMTTPIRQLIDATKRVILGHYDSQITKIPANDIGTLASNFNQMLHSLQRTRSLNSEIQEKLIEKNNFLELVLNNISAGIISLDREGKLNRHNMKSCDILQLDLSTYLGKQVEKIAGEAQNAFEELMQALARPDELIQEWEKEVILKKFATRQVIHSHAIPLSAQLQEDGDACIIVFEDVTEFQQNQRDALWKEVARRLAHEIKNPLTPIRLQSERLQRKILPQLSDSDDINILKRATGTIINQVEAMQAMVNDFSQLAQQKQVTRHPLDINALLKEMSELYSSHRITLDLVADLPLVEGSAVELRQVLHNLIKNALEAIPEGEQEEILCTTQLQQHQVVLSIEDNGCGFGDLEADPLEPYVTSKSKGTGLGLAIVKKILTEHHASIHLEQSSQLKGAKITIIFPLTKTA